MDSNESNESSIEAVAAQWLARRDRGLTAAEQDAYLQWLWENPAHGAMIAELEGSWTRLDGLRDWRPAHSVPPNPDLLLRRQRRSRAWPVALAAAAALAVAAALWWQPAAIRMDDRGAAVHTGPQRLALEDGSWVELRDGASLEIHYTPQQREVQLVKGEAHFIVAQNPARPFVVRVDHFAAQAVGTAFDVRREDGRFAVLVTEGKVRVDEMPADSGSGGRARELSRLIAGQEAVVALRESQVQVHSLAAEEIETALAWQTMRLEFVEMPLRQVAAEFNRYNSRKLVIGDARTGDIVVGGSFRPDNVDGFVRLLDRGFGVSATRRGDEIVMVSRR